VISKEKALAYLGTTGRSQPSSYTSSHKNSIHGFHPAEASTALKASSVSLPKDRHGRPTYSFSQRNRFVRTTAYSCAENEIGAYGNLNAAGTTLKYGMVRSAAADWSRYPLGTRFKIKGLPYTYVVDDYGSALVGTNTIDIYHPNLSLMKKWATRDAEITVIQWGSWERTLALLERRQKYPHCHQMYVAARRNAIGSRPLVSN
jgi:3D (Asp-Asp-Asp) domain-containing protein